MGIAIKKDQVFKCDNCNDVLFKALKDLEQGSVFSAANIDCIQGHQTGDELRCKACGEYCGKAVSPESWE